MIPSLLLLTFPLHLDSCFGVSKLSMKLRTGDRTIIDLTYPEIVGYVMKLDHICGSQIHHGDGPRNLHQTPFSQATKSFSHLPLPARGLGRPGVCYCRMHSETPRASGDFFSLEVCMLLVETLFCLFMHTTSFLRTVYCANL